MKYVLPKSSDIFDVAFFVLGVTTPSTSPRRIIFFSFFFCLTGNCSADRTVRKSYCAAAAYYLLTARVLNGILFTSTVGPAECPISAVGVKS